MTLVYVALGLMFVLPGCLAIWAGLSGSQWFFDNHSYRYLINKLGLGWTRFIFVVLGLLLFLAAALVIIDPLDVMK
ncbi:hypothetical protein ACTML9_01175 [Porphyromonas levii]